VAVLVGEHMAARAQPAAIAQKAQPARDREAAPTGRMATIARACARNPQPPDGRRRSGASARNAGRAQTGQDPLERAQDLVEVARGHDRRRKHLAANPASRFP
jgi:hypothetical protein